MQLIVDTGLFGELAVLPFPAAAPVNETLEFFTDLIVHRDGSEERQAKRKKARQFFNYKIPLQAWQSAATLNTAHSKLRSRWALPIWTEAQYVGNVAALAASIDCQTNIFDLRDESLALLFSGCGNWQIVEIETVGADSIAVANELEAQNGCYLMPVRLAWVQNNFEYKTNGGDWQAELKFEVEDNPFISTSAPTQYAGLDFYTNPGLLSGQDLSRFLNKLEDKTDFQVGPVARSTPWLNSKYGMPYKSLFESQAEIWAYKQWLFRRNGRERAFWMPTFENNLRIKNTGAVTTTLNAASDSFIAADSSRAHVGIRLVSGEWLLRGISSPTQFDSDTLQLTLSSSLGVDASRIAFISYLGQTRLDSDSIEIEHIGNNKAQSTVNVLEISETYNV